MTDAWERRLDAVEAWLDRAEAALERRSALAVGPPPPLPTAVPDGALQLRARLAQARCLQLESRARHRLAARRSLPDTSPYR